MSPINLRERRRISLRNVSVGVRLALGYAIVLALMLASTVLGLGRLAALNGETHAIVDARYPEIELSNQMILDVNVIGASFRNMLLESDEAAIKKEMARAQQSEKDITEALQQLAGMMDTERSRAMLAEVQQARTKAAADEAQFMSLMSAGKWEDGTNFLLGGVRKSQGAALEALQTFVNYNRGRMALASGDADEAYRSARMFLGGLAALATALGCGIAWWISRTITVPLRDAVHVAENVAAGDLTSTIRASSGDETGQLMKALQNMNEALVGIVKDVRGCTDAVTSASEQIAAGNADLSSRTEEQAASLEETAASMEKLYCAVTQTAQHTTQANELATSASTVAAKGGAVVGEVVGTMESINTSSKKIVDIIAVIDGIAFQTNILALNAAVEAARAGEQGRGFAVVASEVRSLAQRSAAAAKEIKQLITDSVNKVESGSRLVSEAGKTMDEIVSAVKRVTDIMGEIAAATQEQSTGIEQVNQAVVHMDEATQQNAALVEEAAAAAESMKDQAGKLTAAVSVFRLSHEEAAGSRAEAIAPAAAARQGSREKAPSALPAPADRAAA